MYMNEAFDSVCFKGSIVSQSARFVYLCLCKHADNTHQTCFPSLNRIAQIVGKSISTVKRAMRELCKYGAVERTPRFRKDGGQTSNLYKIVPCNFDDISKSEAENKAVQDQFEICRTLPLIQNEISYSVPDVNEPARACATSSDKSDKMEQEDGEMKTKEILEPELLLGSSTDDLDNVHSINEIETQSATKPHSVQIANIPGNKNNSLTKRFVRLNKYINRISKKVPSWFRCLKQTICSVKSNIFKKIEPGGGHERPPRNLSI